MLRATEWLIVCSRQLNCRLGVTYLCITVRCTRGRNFVTPFCAIDSTNLGRNSRTETPVFSRPGLHGG